MMKYDACSHCQNIYDRDELCYIEFKDSHWLTCSDCYYTFEKFGEDNKEFQELSPDYEE